MGSKSSKGEIQPITDVWEKISQIGNINIMKNKKNGEIGQERIFTLNPRHDFSKQKQIYAFRRDYDGPLVRTLAVEKQNGKKTSMCGKQHLAKVITERIPLRWSQINHLTFPQSLYSLQQALRGYQELYEKVGPFQVTPNMIGINEGREVKVWLNQNFAQNHPSYEKPVLQTTNITPQLLQRGNSSQANMIRNIIELIERKCESGKFPPNFQRIIDANSNNFFDVRNCLSSYLKTQNIYLPTCLNLNSSINQPLNSGHSILKTHTNELKSNSNNTNRYTIETNRESMPINFSSVKSHINPTSPSNVRQPNIRLLSPNVSTTRTYFSPQRYNNYNVIKSSAPSFGTTNYRQPTTRFTYESRPIQTSQVTHRYY